MESADWASNFNYATICRLCLQRDGFMLGIFNHIQGKEKSIYKKIRDCTALEIAFGDGLPNCICHRCLFKIEFCLEFRQQCFMSDAALRQVNGLGSKNGENVLQNISGQVFEHFNNNNNNCVGGNCTNNDESDVVMVVDPSALDYDSEYETENEQPHSETENVELNDLLYECRNVSMCKFCDQAFTEKSECLAHEANAHNNAIPYACGGCDMGFADRLQYSAHLKSVHQNDKPYKCPQCERTFARRSDLRKHTVVHTGVKPFTCNVCFKSFSRNTNLSKHMRIHSGQKPFVCPKCPKTFISKADLTRHAIIHSGQRPFNCNYCHLTFGRRDKLLRHEKKHLPEKNAKDKSQELQMMRENLSMSNYNYGPPVKESGSCEQNSRTNGDEKQDGWVSSENMVINCDPFNHNNYANLESTPHSDNHSEMDHSNIENDLPRMPDHLDSDSIHHHQNDEINHDLPPVPEHITADSFSTANTSPLSPPLEKSRKYDIKRYPCLSCNKRFSNFEGLQFHMSIHSSERPHSCTICSKCFIRKRELDRHMATHTGMKPFKCPSCAKSFGRKDKLVRHMRIHDVSREHVCVICGASFNRKDGLAHHMKTHVKEENDLMMNNS